MTTTSPSAKPPLDEVMMAMDVVDTLRHDEAVAVKEMNAEDRDARMLERLRQIYKSQGIEVPERILIEGVAGLKQNRFVYSPPKIGFSRTLAYVYVTRAAWGKWLAIAALILALLFASWWFFVHKPQQRAAQALQVELSQTLPNQLAETSARIGQIAVDSAVVADAQAIADDGMRAASAKDVVSARKKLADLRKMEEELNRAFEIRVVSRPGTPTGLTRIPQVNPTGRNYYLVVEAVNADGDVLPRNLTSEEDGKAQTVSIWAQRVPKSTFDLVRKDKERDGVVQNAVLGAKPRGKLETEWRMPVEDGAILKW